MGLHDLKMKVVTTYRRKGFSLVMLLESNLYKKIVESESENWDNLPPSRLREQENPRPIESDSEWVCKGKSS